ncbi:breast cancer metastasis-suppressor 1-like protein isoform X4 [Cherax quadricarinatus]|uniref:breast cancer metastasis-suppressor 1-like protein isoform X4 n=1 Tax=Cherax quadricarinatus TaxID=27406 RepID=UPI00387EE3CE
MPGVKRVPDNERDDHESENEDGDQDSDSDHSSLDESISSDGTESDDSSELDEEECDRRRGEYLTDLSDLERQFSLLREQLYRERVTQVEAKLDEVRVGEATEYLMPLEELQEALRVRLEVACILRQLRLQNISNKHEAELLASKQNFEGSNSSTDRKKKKPTTVAGPYIVYMLREPDIVDDWTTIKKALTASKRKSKCWVRASLQVCIFLLDNSGYEGVQFRNKI